MDSPLVTGPGIPQVSRIRRILVLRTAPVAVVERVIDELRRNYPTANLGLLGANLSGTSAFTHVEKYEIASSWLTPASYRPLARAVARSDFDMAVLCLNNDCGSGFQKASRVMRSIRARHRLVVTLSGTWREWNHGDFESGSFLLRSAINLFGLAIYPITLLALAMMSSKPGYLPRGQGRPSPGYES